MRKYSQLLIFSCFSACHTEPAAVAHPIMGDEPTLAILGHDGVTCAAVALTPDLAVTASHCVEEREVTFVTASRTGQADRTGLGVVVSRDLRSDLAVFSGSGFVPARLAEGAVDYEHATTLVTHVPAPWTVQTLIPVGAREGFLQTKRLDSGMSGSGLWDDGGRLVGIAIGNDARAGYFAGRSRILGVLNDAPISTPPLAPEPRAALWGDSAFGLDELLATAKLRREHIERGLRRLDQRSGHGEQAERGDASTP